MEIDSHFSSISGSCITQMDGRKLETCGQVVITLSGI